MKILVTGAAGFLGREVVRQALAQGHSVRAMVRRDADASALAADLDPQIEYITMDLKTAAAKPLLHGQTSAPYNDPFFPAIKDVDAVIHCAAITSASRTNPEASRLVNVEATRRLYHAAHAAGVRRWIQISSMSAHPEMRSVYGRTKLAADDFLRAQPPSALPEWTILRPSLIYGPGGQGLVEKTTKLLRKLPFVPIVGSGRNLLRPAFVTDIAGAALACIAQPRTAHRTYLIGGSDEVSLNEFMTRLAKAAGTPRSLFHLPVPFAFIMAKILETLLGKPPLTVDNVLGVQDLARVEQKAAVRDWGYAPRGLEQGLRETFDSSNGNSG